jgi:aspartyl/asparaginyl-tRNA synthetase
MAEPSSKPSANAKQFLSQFIEKHPEHASKHEFSKRTPIGDFIHLGEANIDKEVTIAGWVKTRRLQGQFTFIELTDGSCPQSLQIFVDNDVPGYEGMAKAVTGASVLATGKIVKSPGKGQVIELKATSVKLLGECDAEKYPLPKKQHTAEYLRSVAHLRVRTNLVSIFLKKIFIFILFNLVD